ncbi:MAG: hypothetical protein ABSB11_06125 [Sedimentisphaerales bacterium]|jgi:hypothetical protein
MAKQLTIFLENRPGRLMAMAKSLIDNNIDIRAFTIQDRGDYGLIKLIVNNPSQAYLALANLGCACALKDIIAISIPDKIGNFELLTSALAQNNINVKDAYGFVLQTNLKGVCCLEIEESKAADAQKVIQAAGFTILKDDELYNL